MKGADLTILDLYEKLSSNIDTYIRYLSYSKEIVMRCPFCGDSIKHSNKGHLYIGENNLAFLYHCKRAECNATGIVNKSFLESLNITDINLISDIHKHNININFNNTNQKIGTIKNNINSYSSYNFDNMELKLENYNKLKYIQNRLYIDEIKEDIFSLDLNKYRIILSPKHFIDFFNLRNKLNKFQLNKIDYIDKVSIGFLNMNGTCISFRSIYDDADFRYLKFNLGNIVDVYSIKNELDLCYKTPIINISEGSFDIINISYRLKDQFNFDKNDIFLASNGADYRNKIEYMAKYLGLVNFNIRIFRDNDKSINSIIKQFNKSIFRNSIEVYYNTLGKDYSEDKLFVIKDIF